MSWNSVSAPNDFEEGRGLEQGTPEGGRGEKLPCLFRGNLGMGEDEGLDEEAQQ